MSFRASNTSMDQKPSRQVKQKRRSAYGRQNEYDLSEGHHQTYSRREKYNNWKTRIVDDDFDDEDYE